MHQQHPHYLDKMQSTTESKRVYKIIRPGVRIQMVVQGTLSRNIIHFFIHRIHKWRPTWVELAAKHEIEAF